MTYKIVIADDHNIVASALEKLIESFKNCEVLYKVSNGRQLLDRFKTPRNIPDLVLLDISMPIMDGFKTMKHLNADYPDVKVLGLSMEEDEHAYLKLIELGANGFFSKMGTDEELELAINTVMNRNVYYSEDVTTALFNMLKERNKDNAVLITKREKEMLSYIGSELTYAQIAKKMSVSAKTVDGYRNSLFKKLKVHSRTTLALYAYANGYYVDLSL